MESPGQNLGLRLWRNGLKPWRNMVFRIADMTVKVAAVVVAAGRGLRAGGDLPKQYRSILGEPVIRPSLATLARHASVSAVQPVIHPDDAELYGRAIDGLDEVRAMLGEMAEKIAIKGLEVANYSMGSNRNKRTERVLVLFC